MDDGQQFIDGENIVSEEVDARIEIAQAQVEPLVDDSEITPVKLPETLTPDSNNVVSLPEGIALEEFEFQIDGDDLLMVKADGSEIRILGGSASVPTFLIGDIELPQEVVALALGESKIDVAAGSAVPTRASGSGSDFKNEAAGLNEVGELNSLLGNTRLNDPAFADDQHTLDDRAPVAFRVDLERDFGFIFDDDAQDNGNQGGDNVSPDEKSYSGSSGTLFTTDDPFGSFVFDIPALELLNIQAIKTVDSSGDPMAPIKVALEFVQTVGATSTKLVANEADTENPVFVITVQDDGSFVIDINAPLAHGIPGTEEENLSLTFHFTISDIDGDPASGSLTFAVNDDTPVAYSEANEIVNLDDDLLPDGNTDTIGGDGEAATLVQTPVQTGRLDFSGGADGATVAWDFTSENTNTYGDETGNAPGDIIFIKGDSSSEGYQTLFVCQWQQGVEGSEVVEIMTAVLNVVTGEYEISQINNLFHAAGGEENNQTFKLGYIVTDGDGDTALATLTINLDDDTLVVHSRGGRTGRVDEDGLEGGNLGSPYGNNDFANDKTSVSRSLRISWGADNENINVNGGFDSDVGQVYGDRYVVFKVAAEDDNTDQSPVGSSSDVAPVASNFETVLSAKANELNINLNDFRILSVSEANALVDVRNRDGIDASELTSDGKNIIYVVSEDGTRLTAISVDEQLYNLYLEEFGDVNGGENEITPLSNKVSDSDGVQDEDEYEIEAIFDVTLSDLGAGHYNFELLNNLDHPMDNLDYSRGGREDNLRLQFNLEASDSDGDVVDHSFGVIIDDDGPKFGDDTGSPQVDEDGVINGNVGEEYPDSTGDQKDFATGTVNDNRITVTQNLNVLWGADNADAADDPDGVQDLPNGDLGNRSLTFTSNVVKLIGSNDPEVMTSHGEAVKFRLIEDGTVLEGYVESSKFDDDGEDRMIFTVSLSDDGVGSYTFKLLDALDHNQPNVEDNLRLEFKITAKDSDGDTASTTFQLRVDDDGPKLGDIENKTIDEDDRPVNGETSVSGNLAIQWGADDGDAADDNGDQDVLSGNGNRSVVFKESLARETDLKSNGEVITYHLNTDCTVLTASTTSGNKVFTVSLSDDGTGRYTFELFNDLDYLAGSTENDILLDFDFVVTDSDGDTQDGLFTVTVEDDGPKIGATENKYIDEDDLLGANNDTATGDNLPVDGETSVFGNLAIQWGANNGDVSDINGDQDTLSVNGNRSVVFKESLARETDLKSNGEVITYHLNTDCTVLTASTDNGGIVFTVSLSDDGTGSYTFKLYNNLDHPAGDNENDIPLDFGFVVTDSNGDTQSSSFTVTVDDDTPIATTPGIEVVRNSGWNSSLEGILLDIKWGADDSNSGSADRSLDFAVGSSSGFDITVTNRNGTEINLASGGMQVNFVTIGDVLVGYTGSPPTSTTAGNVVLTAFLSDAAGSLPCYDFNLLKPLDHPWIWTWPWEQNFLDLKIGYTATDSDGDVSNKSSFTVRVDVRGFSDPILLDLDGDGVEALAASSGVTFDIDADGQTEQIGWVGADDGLLVVDLDGSGSIENGSEVLSEVYNGGNFANSVEALRSLDENGDGVLDANDAGFDDILVWQDADSDGVSDAGELKTLSEHGITSLDLDALEANRDINGNTVFAEGTFTKDDGSTGSYVGIDFAQQEQQRRANNQDNMLVALGAVVTLEVLANTIVASEAASLIIVGQPEHGTVTVNDDMSVNYTSNGVFVGEDSFTYQVADLVGNVHTETVKVTVGDVDVTDTGADSGLDDTSVAALIAGDDENSTPQELAALVDGDEGVQLIGTDGDDVLIGGKGADVLIGGKGADTYTGGEGADTFVIDTSAFLEAGMADLITDYDSEDTINLADLLEDALGTPASEVSAGNTVTLKNDGTDTEVVVNNGSEEVTVVTLEGVHTAINVLYADQAITSVE